MASGEMVRVHFRRVNGVNFETPLPTVPTTRNDRSAPPVYAYAGPLTYELPMTNLQSTIKVQLDQESQIGHRVTLVERLQRISGVTEARFDSGNHRQLTITFREGSLSPPTLLDFLATHNAPGTLSL